MLEPHHGGFEVLLSKGIHSKVQLMAGMPQRRSSDYPPRMRYTGNEFGKFKRRVILSPRDDPQQKNLLSHSSFRQSENYRAHAPEAIGWPYYSTSPDGKRIFVGGRGIWKV